MASIFKILRYCGLGILGYMFPRILVAFGIPLDRWALEIGFTLTGIQNVISSETALTILGAIFAITLMTIELWWQPLGKFFKRSIKVPNQAEPKKEETIKITGEEEAFVRGFNHAASHTVSTKEAALLLAQLRTEGVGIRNSASKLCYTSDLDGWSHKVTEWMNDVIETLKSVSSADSEWFATLDAVPPARVPAPRIRLGGDADRMMFLSMYDQHDFRLVRLEKLLKKYGVAA